MNSDSNVWVASYDTVENICKMVDATHLITTLEQNIDFEPPSCIKSKNFSRFTFDDTMFSTLSAAPRLDQISDIYRVITSLQSDTKLVVNCHMGLSRSTAVAFAAMVYRLKDIDHAVQNLLRVRPSAIPNKLICDHFDHIMGYKGMLLEAASFIHDKEMSEVWGINPKPYTSLYK